MASEHIHVPGDGRGFRQVFLNGKKLSRCHYADVKKGKAKIIVSDENGRAKLDKYKKRFIEKTLHGHVTVVPLEKRHD